MNPFFKNKIFSIVFFLCLNLFSNSNFAQEIKSKPVVLSIQEAIRIAKENNDWISMAKLNKEVSEAELKEVKSHVYPHIMAEAGAKRLSNITLYEHGLSGAESLPPPPSVYNANFGVEASFNLYSGGKHEALIEESEIKTKLSDTKIEQQTGSISLQVVQNYLEIIRLSKLDLLHKEQISREEERLKNIKSLYKNGKVTRSDLLRAEVNLSNKQFERTENLGNIRIFNNRMNVLLKNPEDTQLVLSDSTIVKMVPNLMNLENSNEDNAYEFISSKQNIELQEAKIKGAKSNYYPSIELVTGYSFSYPNYLIYPYVDQAYSIGFVGFKMKYTISSLYQNNHKVSAEKQHLLALKNHEEAIRDNIKLEISSLKIKIENTQEKMDVAEKNIEQSNVNLKIVTTKYFNQLALLTDLLEADNLYLQSKYKLIEAQTSLLNYYYQILYTTGKI